MLDLTTREQKILIRGGSHARYVPTGHLVYGVGGTLRAVAFDLRRLEVVGTPVPVLEQVMTTPAGANMSISDDGTLVYVPGGAQAAAGAHAGVGGSAGTRGATQGAAAGLRVSAALARRNAGGARRARPGDGHLDLGPRAGDADAVHLRSGARYSSASGRRTGSGCCSVPQRRWPANLFWQAADGTGAVERLTESPNDQSPQRGLALMGRSWSSAKRRQRPERT